MPFDTFGLGGSIPGDNWIFKRLTVLLIYVNRVMQIYIGGLTIVL